MPSKKRRLNWKPDLPCAHDKKYALHPEKLAATPDVTAVDLRSKCSPIEDQGDLGSCTGHAIVGNLEFLELQEIAANMAAAQSPEVFDVATFDPISRLYIYYNERQIEGDVSSDAGATLSDGTQAVQTYGVCRESLWPYSDALAFRKPSDQCYAEGVQHKVLFAYRLNDLDDMKTCLKNGFPFVMGIGVYDSFMSPEVEATGQVPMPNLQTETLQGGHAVCCVGFNDQAGHLIVRNSWGTSWGDGGYFYLPYAYATDLDLTSDLWTLRRQ
jgi:C1A family cysteine protease